MKKQQEKAQYVELVKSIFINLEKIDELSNCLQQNLLLTLAK
nr:hypothetical protein [Mycoplasmopsis bovis]